MMNFADLEIIEYTEDMGKVNWPDGFAQTLAGKSLEEQIRHYMISADYYIPLSYYMHNWAKDFERGDLLPLDSYWGWEKVILRDGLVVGFVRSGRTILPYRVVSSDTTSENNGAGYKERIDYAYLMCVPEKLEQELRFTPPFGAPVPELTIPVIPYDGSRGEDPLPEGFAARLVGKPLAVQMYYFSLVDDARRRRERWVDDWDKYGGYRLSDLVRGRLNCLPLRDDVLGLIVQDGKIVGVRVRLEENAIGGNTADLYPYEKRYYKIKHEGSIHGLNALRELTCECFPG